MEAGSAGKRISPGRGHCRRSLGAHRRGIGPAHRADPPGGWGRRRRFQDAEARKVIERLAVGKVMEVERSLGREPTDVGVPGHPYDIESRIPETGELLMIEVRAGECGGHRLRHEDEMLVGFNKADKYILAIVMVEDGVAQEPKYVRKPFDTEPGFAVTSVNLDIDKLLARAEKPS